MTKEQVTQSTTEKIGDPALSQMMRAIMDYVAALTKASEVAKAVVGRIVI